MSNPHLESNATAPSLRETLITASRRTDWDIDQLSNNFCQDSPEIDLKVSNQVLSQALKTFNDILGAFPYVSITFASPTSDNTPGEGQKKTNKYTQIHLTRPKNDPNSIAVDIIPEGEKGARYSDISARVFGVSQNGEVVLNSDSLGDHLTLSDAREIQRFSYRCQEAVQFFQTNDVVLQLNPQGVQEYVNQPLGGIKDTGGQNKYVECFSRALGRTVPEGKESAPSQILVNRSGPSQDEILSSSNPPELGGDPAIRKGLHFFPDENVCLAFVEDSSPELFQLKEQSHPRWEKVGRETTPAAGSDVVTVSNGALRSFGIEDGVYFMVDAGPMKELAEKSRDLLDYFKISDTAHDKLSERKVVLANHYVDAAYLAEFVSRELGGHRFESFFFLHSLGTFKAEGLNYPDKLQRDVELAGKLESQLRLKDRILGELWVVQRCKQSLIANSTVIGEHAFKYLGAKHEPPTMIAVDDDVNGHIDRADRRTLALETFQDMHKFYLETCDNPMLGAIVPTDKRLSLEQLIDAQIIFERSRHAEADSKGKWAVVKAMAIAQSDDQAQADEAPDRVLMINVNLLARDGLDEKFSKEIKTIVADLKSIRDNGGHVIVQQKFEYHFGLDVCKVSDCYVALPAFEPFGMGVLEAAAAGAPVVARSDVPSVREILSGKVGDIKFPIRNGSVKVGIAEGAILVGGHPDHDQSASKYTEDAYSGAAVAINAITLGVEPTTPALSFNPKVMGDTAAALVKGSHYNWTNVAQRFLEVVYED